MSWDKYGSPYDPNHSGKMVRPQERREEERREREQRSICPCGDPRCTAHLDGKGGALGAPPSSNANRSYEIDLSEMIRGPFSSRMDEVLRGALGLTGDEARSSATARPAKPPESYRKARKDVEKWLAKAPDQAFDDIVGNDEALAQLRDAIQAPVKHKELYAAYGMSMPKGALLSGPPGCGKTMFARAAAAEMKRLYGTDVEFISISGSELQSPYVGVTEGHIKAIFVFAREYRAFHGHPLLVFMDEAEVLLPDRTGRVRRVAAWEESQVATFLAEMDGMQESGAFMLLATNRPEVIDQAVLRDGRCDFKIVVKRPTAAAIELILRKNFDGMLVGDDSVEQLVFAATEALFDPHKVIAEARAVGLDLAEHQLKDLGGRHFLLEHIVSGAMAASVPGRAKRYAFARDKGTGIAKGVGVADVLQAVNDLFEENRSLDHSFALEEWKREFVSELRAEAGGGRVHSHDL